MECLTLASPPPPPRSDQPPSPTSSTSNSSSARTPPFPPTTPPFPPTTPQRRPSLILQETPPPTTFVHTDPSSFKHVVQRLTGLPSEPARKILLSSSDPSPPTRPHLSTIKKSSSFKLYERRREKTLRNLKLSDRDFSFVGNASSPVQLSPSAVLDLTQLSLISPVRPLDSDPIAAAAVAEERAIARKGFYLHPSTPRRSGESVEPPRLLRLFPVTSPRTSSLPPSS